MKKNKIIAKGLYREALRETRTPAIIFAAIVFIMTLGTFAIHLIENAAVGLHQTQIIDLYETVSSCSLLIILAAPIMSLRLYGYVNTRKTADFYHSLPYTRECIYFSSFAAASTWLLSILTGVCGISLVLYSVIPNYHMNFASAPVIFLSLAVTILYSFSAVSLAVSLTGTRFMNIVVSILVLFAPRALIDSVIRNFTAAAPSIVVKNLPFFLNTDNNLFYRSTTTFFIAGSKTFSNVTGLLYTLFLTVLYTAGACLINKVRKSETAHKASTTRILQTVFRITFALFLVIWTFPLLKLTELYTLAFIWYGIVVILYFAFELITTRKWKNVLLSMPGLLIAIALSLMIYFGTSACAKLVLSFEPDGGQITGVRIITDKVNDTSELSILDSLFMGDYEEQNYESMVLEKSSDIVLRDDVLNDKISSVLKKNNQSVKNEMSYGSDTLTVAVRTGNKETERVLFLTSDEKDFIISRLEKNEQYRKNYKTVPKCESVTVSDGVNNIPVPDDIYECFAEEIAESDFTEWKNYVNDGYFSDDRQYFNVIVKEGLETNTYSIPFGMTVAPKAYSRVVSELLFDREKAKEMIDKLDSVIEYYESNGLDREMSSASIDVYGHFFDNDSYREYYVDADFSEYDSASGNYSYCEALVEEYDDMKTVKAKELVEVLRNNLEEEFSPEHFAVVEAFHTSQTDCFHLMISI